MKILSVISIKKQTQNILENKAAPRKKNCDRKNP